MNYTSVLKLFFFFFFPSIWNSWWDCPWCKIREENWASVRIQGILKNIWRHLYYYCWLYMKLRDLWVFSLTSLFHSLSTVSRMILLNSWIKKRILSVIYYESPFAQWVWKKSFELNIWDLINQKILKYNKKMGKSVLFLYIVVWQISVDLSKWRKKKHYFVFIVWREDIMEYGWFYRFQAFFWENKNTWNEYYLCKWY